MSACFPSVPLQGKCWDGGVLGDSIYPATYLSYAYLFASKCRLHSIQHKQIIAHAWHWVIKDSLPPDIDSRYKLSMMTVMFCFIYAIKAAVVKCWKPIRTPPHVCRFGLEDAVKLCDEGWTVSAVATTAR